MVIEPGKRTDREGMEEGYIQIHIKIHIYPIYHLLSPQEYRYHESRPFVLFTAIFLAS